MRVHESDSKLWPSVCERSLPGLDLPAALSESVQVQVKFRRESFDVTVINKELTGNSDKETVVNPRLLFDERGRQHTTRRPEWA